MERCCSNQDNTDAVKQTVKECYAEKATEDTPCCTPPETVEALEKLGYSLCPVDGKEIKKDLHVDIVGLRLYACSEECLTKVRQKKFVDNGPSPREPAASAPSK